MNFDKLSYHLFMGDTFLLNPSTSLLNIKDTIHSKLAKVKAIASCLLVAVYGDGKLTKLVR